TVSHVKSKVSQFGLGLASKRHLFKDFTLAQEDRPIGRQPIAIRVKEIWSSKSATIASFTIGRLFFFYRKSVFERTVE
ncbi:hypothetical protein TNCV_935011, partial [Trichonephila clavipes]